MVTRRIHFFTTFAFFEAWRITSEIKAYLAIGDGVKDLVDLVWVVDIHFDGMRIDAGVSHHDWFDVVNHHLVQLATIEKCMKIYPEILHISGRSINFLGFSPRHYRKLSKCSEK